MNKEAERLWEKWASDIRPNYHNFLMTRTDFKNALSDYDPWVYDREPTREDGDEYGFVIVWEEGREWRTKYLALVSGRPWRKIQKPKKG